MRPVGRHPRGRRSPSWLSGTPGAVHPCDIRGEEQVQRVLAHYETQTETEAVAEDEATLASPDQALVSVPHELVPVVRELIAKHRK